VVINNFNVAGVSIVPDKAHAPLIIDADAVLPGPAAAQGFQPVSPDNKNTAPNQIV